MKKLLIFTVTAAMLLSLAACAQSAKPAAKPEKPAQTETADSKNAQAETAETENVRIIIRGRIMIRRTMPRRPQASISLCRTKFPAARKNPTAS